MPEPNDPGYTLDDSELLSPPYKRPGARAHAWDEAQHPRHPAGSEQGGEFAPAGGGSAAAPAGATAHAAHVALAARLHAPDGGFTYDPKTEHEPTSGYVVSAYPEHSKAIRNAATMSADDLADQVTDYVIAKWEMLTQADHQLGGWHDPSDGTVYLDVVQVKASEDAHDQKAFFDLKNMRTVVVNPGAKSGQK